MLIEVHHRDLETANAVLDEITSQLKDNPLAESLVFEAFATAPRGSRGAGKPYVKFSRPPTPTPKPGSNGSQESQRKLAGHFEAILVAIGSIGLPVVLATVDYWSENPWQP